MEISTIKDIKVRKLRFIPDARATCFMVSLSPLLVGQTPTRFREKVLQRTERFSYKMVLTYDDFWCIMYDDEMRLKPSLGLVNQLGEP